MPAGKRVVQPGLQSEMTRLKCGLKRAQQERDILKEAAVDSTCQRVKVQYRFIKSRAHRYPIRRLCDVLQVHPSGYYAWLKQPLSACAQQGQVLLPRIKKTLARQWWLLWVPQHSLGFTGREGRVWS